MEGLLDMLVKDLKFVYIKIQLDRVRRREHETRLRPDRETHVPAELLNVVR
jgi:hypothetical protein